jgi:hypothetical protein
MYCEINSTQIKSVFHITKFIMIDCKLICLFLKLCNKCFFEKTSKFESELTCPWFRGRPRGRWRGRKRKESTGFQSFFFKTFFSTFFNLQNKVINLLSRQKQNKHNLPGILHKLGEPSFKRLTVLIWIYKRSELDFNWRPSNVGLSG